MGIVVIPSGKNQNRVNFFVVLRDGFYIGQIVFFYEQINEMLLFAELANSLILKNTLQKKP